MLVLVLLLSRLLLRLLLLAHPSSALAMELPKRPRSLFTVSSQGLRFSLSPVAVKREEAISAKKRDHEHRDHEHRSFNVHSLTAEQAMEQRAEDLLLCVSPKGTSSNKRLRKLTFMESQFHVYFTLLGSSPAVCEVDLVQYLLRHLDYSLKRYVRDEIRKKGLSFEEDLLGSRKERPFQSLNGNNVRYGVLLQFTDCMEKLTMDADVASRYHIYLDLLHRCEQSLLESLEKVGATYTEEENKALVEHIREEILDFFGSETKEDRDVASHVFCDLLCVETSGSLEEMDLEGEIFPSLDYRAFDMSRPCMRHNMALKVLVLKDLQEKFKANKIGKFTHEAMKAAFKLVYSCIQQNVEASWKVTCGNMVAVIPGQREGSELDIVELESPPSMRFRRALSRV